MLKLSRFISTRQDVGVFTPRVPVYHRTKRSIIKPSHIGMRTSHYPNVFNGTITLKGIRSL